MAWAIFWVLATVGGFVVGAVGGGILGAILGAAGASMQSIRLLCGALGFLLTVPLSYIVFRFAITKFILPKLSVPDNSAPPIPAT